MKNNRLVKFQNVAIIDMEASLPHQWISSEEIEKNLSLTYQKLLLNPGRIVGLTGVHRRGIFPKGTLPSTIASEAALPLLRRQSNIDEIDLLIYAGVSKDFVEPSTAARVHHHLKLSSHCLNFDISSACLGFMTAIEMASQMINAKQIRKALVVTGENSASLLEGTIRRLSQHKTIQRNLIKQMTASLTLGSGGVAWLLGPKENYQDCPSIDFTSTYASTQLVGYCTGDGTKEDMWMETDSEKLLKEGIDQGKIHWDLISSQYPEYQHLFTHQVSKGYSDALVHELKLDENKMFNTFDQFGNMGSAALPFTLMESRKHRNFSKNDKVILIGIGSGLNTQVMGINWN